MVRLIFLLTIFGFNPAFYAQDSLLVRFTNSRSESGYMTPDSTVVVTPGRFIACYTEKTNGFALVLSDTGPVAINLKGEIVFTVHPNDIKSKDVFRIISGNKYGYARLNGDTIALPMYDIALPFTDRFGFVNIGAGQNQEASQWQCGKWGAVNLRGRVVVPIQYTDVNFQGSSGVWIKTNQLNGNE